MLDVSYLWNSLDELLWRNKYLTYINNLDKTNLYLFNFLDKIKIDDIDKMSVQEFYNFLYDFFFPFQYSSKTNLNKCREEFEQYILKENLNELDEIRKKLITIDLSNYENAIEEARKIYGLGYVGATALLSILYPNNFVTIDQFLLYALYSIDSLKDKIITVYNPVKRKPIIIDDKRTKIRLTSLSHGELATNLLKNKSIELNNKASNFWNPKKIGLILSSLSKGDFWGTGIPKYMEEDILSESEIFYLCYSKLLNKLEEDSYTNIISQPRSNIFPTVAAKKNGVFYFFLLRTKIISNDELINDTEQTKFIMHCKKYNAIPIVMITLVSPKDLARKNLNLFLKNDQFSFQIIKLENFNN